VVATPDNPNGGVGASSAPSLPSAQVTPPTSATAAFAPLSTATGFNLGTGNTTLTLQDGNTLTVDFNTAVTIAPTAFSLTVTDGANTATLTPLNSTLTASSPTSVVYTITAPSVPGTPHPILFSAAQPLEVINQSGVSNSVGPWNLVGSLSVNGPYTAVFDGTIPTLATAANGAVTTPFVTQPNQVTAPAGQNTLNVSGTTGDTASVYTENGTLLGSATVVAGVAAVPLSSTVLASTVLIVSQEGAGYLSESGVLVGFSILPIATAGSLTTAGINVSFTLSSLPGLVENLAFTPGAGSAGESVHINGSATALTASTPTAFSATGQIQAVYTSGTNVNPNTDTLNANNGAGTVGFDTYTY